MAAERAYEARAFAMAVAEEVETLGRACADRIVVDLTSGERVRYTPHGTWVLFPHDTRRQRGVNCRLPVVRRDGACVQCGGTFMLAAHHVIPRAEGGPDSPENLETLCVSCHARLEAEQRYS